MQKNFSILALVMAAGLAQAQATNTTPNHKLIPTPIQVALQNEIQQSTQNSSQSTPQNNQKAAPDATQNTQDKTLNVTPNTPNPRANVTPNAQPAQGSTSPAGAQSSPAIAAMQSAKSALQQAGNAWGGHKVTALRLINSALGACGVKQTNNLAALNSPAPANDARAAMQSAMTQLNAARSEFANAGNSTGGCGPDAPSLIDQTLKELEAGIEFAKSHNNY